MWKKKEKTTYRYPPESTCKTLDNTLRRVLSSQDNYVPDDKKYEKDFAFVSFLYLYGLVEKTESAVTFYTPKIPDAARFLEKGGFNGERLKKIQDSKDKKNRYLFNWANLFMTLIVSIITAFTTVFFTKCN